MAASGRPKRSKGKDQRRFIANVRQHGPETSEEEILRQYGDGESISKQSVLALKIAFDDIRGKYLKSQAENNVLREKLEMGFKAYDDKYKETEKLKQELDFKEKEITDKNTDGTSYQDTNEESEDSTITKESVDLEQTHDANKSFRTISTQTYEEKTDEVALPCTDYQKLLKFCGLEVILQDDKAILMLTNRDDLKLWLENETDGKVSVAFEQTSMCERSIQTDDNYTSIDVNPGQEAMIIKLRSKIYDQANVINKYRQTVEQMMQNTSKVQMAKEETSKSAENKIIHVFKNYHQTVLIRSQVAVNHIMSLKKQLESQQNYCKHLLQAIKDTRVLIISNVSQPKLHGGLREIKKPPESPSAEGHSDENLSYDERLDEITTSGHLNMPVQESDKQLDSNESGPTNTVEESSASVITLPESRSSSSEKSGLPPNQSEGHASASSGSVVTKTSAASAKHSKTRSSGSERFPVPSPRRKTDRSLSPPGTVVVQSCNAKQKADVASQDDDFEVINEDYLAVGGTSGISIRAKECPVCFISYSPASSQEEFEAHVGAHFRD